MDSHNSVHPFFERERHWSNEEALRMNDEEPGRFWNLKPRLLRSTPTGAADHEDEEQEPGYGQENGGDTESSTLH